MKFLATLSLCANLAAAVWPVPQSYSHGKGVVFIDQSAQFQYSAPGGTYGKGKGKADDTITSSAVVQAAIERTKNDLFINNLDPWKFYPRATEYQPAADGAVYIKKVTLKQTEADPKDFYKAKDGKIDESYTLHVGKKGAATISAKSSIGLVRGLSTFTQLFFKSDTAGSAWTKLAPVKIDDAPKFVHRGLNMDVSRHYMGVSDIKRNIDALAFNKFNRLHLHITDAQSWPLEITAMPELSAKGAYRPDMVYSVADFEDLQSYAALQGVQLITEIDSPGHTSSVAYSQPDLIAAFDVQPNWGTYAAEPPSGTLKLNSSDVDDFMNTLYGDLLPRILPYSSYFHSGGDEVKAAAYELDETVNSSKVSVITPLLQRFVNRNHDQIRKEGLTPMVWEEMLLEWGLELGKDVVVQTWQSDQAVLQTVNKGYKALAGNYNYWYLDCGRGQWLDFLPQDAAGFWPFEDYCAPLHNWRLMYSYDPLQGIPESKQHLVLGGEVHIWAEQTDPTNLDKMVWPRAAAAGEVLWSGAKDESGQNRSQVVASPRLSEMRERLVAKGVGAEPIHMPYCLMYPESCVYHA